MRVFRPTPRNLAYTIEFRDHAGIFRRLASHQRDRSNARDCGEMISRLVESRHNGRKDPPDHLWNWIDAMREEMRTKLIGWGVIDAHWWGQRNFIRTPLLVFEGEGRKRTVAEKCLVYQWWDEMRATKAGAGHALQQRQKAVQVFEAGKMRTFADVTSSAVANVLFAMRTAGIGNRRSNALRQACFQFCRWLCRKMANRIVNPLDDRAVLPKLNEDVDRRRVRRGLELEEARKLLATTKGQPERHGLTGEARAMVYHLGIATGLRHGEIRQLRRCDFHLDESPAVVVVPAKVSKHRREDVLVLQPELVQSLAKFVEAGLFAPAARLFPLDARGAEMLGEDLKAAGIAAKDGAGRVVDFHALRHTCGCWCFGVYEMNPREVQERLRVGSLKLVERYSASLRLRSESLIMSKSPKLLGDGEGEEKKAGGA